MNNLEKKFSRGSDATLADTEYTTKHHEVDISHKNEPRATSIISSNKRAPHIFMFLTKKDIPLLIAGILIMCITAIGTPALTLLYGKIFKCLSDNVAGKYPSYDDYIHDMKLYCFLILALGAVVTLLMWVGIYIWLQIGEISAARVRRHIYDNFFQKPVEWYDLNEELLGDLNQVNRCIEELRSGSSETVAFLIQSVACIIFLSITAFIYSWSLTLVILASTPLMAISAWYFGTTTERYTHLENHYTADCSRVFDWSLTSPQHVRLFNAKTIEIEKFIKASEASASFFFKLSFSIAANVSSLRTLGLLMFVQGFWFGTVMIMKGKLSVDQVFTCFSACLMLGQQFNTISSLLASIQRGKVATQRIMTFLDCPQFTTDSVTLHPSNISLYPRYVYGNIIFKGVKFNYPSRPEVQILRDVNLFFPSHQISYVVGKSGSGKSTIAQLIMNNYLPSTGKVVIDGFDLENLNTKWLTDNITLVSQNSTTFNDTIKNNISMGIIEKADSMENISESRIREAADFSLLSHMLETLPDGINTIVGDGGALLSGGQLQRIALARARMRDTPILILDEAVSALDIPNRNKLMARIKNWRKGKTTIIMTHDFSHIDENDYVYIMEHGQIVERGYRSDIGQDEKGVFYKFWNTPDDSSIENPFESELEREERKMGIIESYVYPEIKEEKSTIHRNESDDFKNVQLLSIFRIVSTMMSQTETRLFLVCGILAAVANGVVNPLFSYFFSKLMEGIVNLNVNQGSYLVRGCMIVLGIAVSDGLTTFMKMYFLSYSAERWILSLRERVFRNISAQGLLWFEINSGRAAETTALLMNDTRDLRNLVSQFLAIIFTLAILLVVGTVWSLVIGWKLSLVGMSFLPLFLIVSTIYSNLLQSSENSYKGSVSSEENLVHDTVKGIRTIKNLRLNKYFYSQFESKIKKLRQEGNGRALKIGFGIALSGLVNYIAQGTILFYGMSLIGKDDYSSAQVMQIFTLLIFSMSTVSSLLSQLPDLTRGQRSGTLITKLLDLDISNSEKENGEIPLKSKVVVSFKSLNFAYPLRPSVNVLKHFSLDIIFGETICIVGESGSGKSTIASLLTRLYETGSGKLFIDGTDINKIDVNWLRSNISLVSQESSFFEGSLRENLLYGIPANSKTDEVIHQVLELVNLHQFVSLLPEGLDSRVGRSSGSLISGGQAQRISIARALLHDPKILILDECTSALDPENSEIIADLVKYKLATIPGLTIIIITHDKQMMECGSRLVEIHEGIATEIELLEEFN